MKKILFLDDDESLCFLMKEVFKEEPTVEVTTVNSYAALLEQQPVIADFDIIFLDVNLGPGQPTGLDAFAWLKTQSYNKKVVFFTGHAQAYPLVRQAVKTPNVYVLEKPASVAQIEEFING